MFGLRILAALAIASALWLTPVAAQERPSAPSAAPAPVAPATTAPTDPAAAEAARKSAAAKEEADKNAAAAKAEADKKTAAAKVEAEKKEAAAKEEAAKKAATLFQGAFQSEVLAGGTQNDFRVPQPLNRLGVFETTLQWEKSGREWQCSRSFDSSPPPPDSKDISVDSRAPDRNDTNRSVFGIQIASPPCLWPLTQRATITITAPLDNGAETKQLFHGTMPVSVLWFPLTATFLILALIYPGGAAASWYTSQRRHAMYLERATAPDQKIPEPPSFWAALDPVELTKNPYGRGSIAKLQIFVFTFIVFGLLLFNVMRNGLLANMSPDVLYLMGISAAGAVGGKLTYVARRRLNLENWAWLRRKKWLPPEGDVAPRARWSDLFTDSGGKEFDPYRFQMAVFSVVVAIALIRTSAGSLEAFKIPTELLALLGISHTVFVAGQGIDNTGYDELDKKLDDVRKHEKKYLDLKVQVEAATARAVAQGLPYPPPADKDGKTASGELLSALPKPDDATAELNAFRSGVAQAAEMFWAIYGPQLMDMSSELKNSSTMEPKLSG
ncbi:MAG TPA: hypothetical protein VGF53_11540 [Pseudolabrys sp.]|jgi:hypothetical protein